jgi:hypothetical protein
VHSTSANPSATQPAKFLAIVFTKKGDPVTIPGRLFPCVGAYPPCNFQEE